VGSTRSHDSSIPYQANCERQTKPKERMEFQPMPSMIPCTAYHTQHISKPPIDGHIHRNAGSSSPFLVGNTSIHNIYMILCRRPTLIFGEPGLEKDNIAAQIHYRSSKHQEWPIARFDGSKLDSYGSQLFGRGSKQGLLHWVGQGTLLLTNVHKVSLTCCSPMSTR